MSVPNTSSAHIVAIFFSKPERDDAVLAQVLPMGPDLCVIGQAIDPEQGETTPEMAGIAGI